MEIRRYGDRPHSVGGTNHRLHHLCCRIHVCCRDIGLSDAQASQLAERQRVFAALIFHLCRGGWYGGLSGAIGSWDRGGLVFALAGFGCGFGVLFVLWLIGGGGGAHLSQERAAQSVRERVQRYLTVREILPGPIGRGLSYGLRRRFGGMILECFSCLQPAVRRSPRLALTEKA